MALELEEGPDGRARDTAVFLGQLGQKAEDTGWVKKAGSGLRPLVTFLPIRISGHPEVT